jgi:hypothetical protein
MIYMRIASGHAPERTLTESVWSAVQRAGDVVVDSCCPPSNGLKQARMVLCHRFIRFQNGGGVDSCNKGPSPTAYYV